MQIIKLNQRNFDLINLDNPVCKVSTVRKHPCFMSLGFALIVCVDTLREIEVEVNEVRTVRFGILDDMDANLDGFRDIQALSDELERCYGKPFHVMDPVDVIYFQKRGEDEKALL